MVRSFGMTFESTGFRVLDFLRPKSAVFQMSESVESNISFTLRFLKAYYESMLNCLRA